MCFRPINDRVMGEAVSVGRSCTILFFFFCLHRLQLLLQLAIESAVQRRVQAMHMYRHCQKELKMSADLILSLMGDAISIHRA